MPKDVEIKIDQPNDIPIPSMHLIVSKARIKEIKVGEKARFDVSGEVEGIHKIFDTDMYGIDLKGGMVGAIEVNKADRDLKDMKSQVEVMNEADRGLRDSLEV